MLPENFADVAKEVEDGRREAYSSEMRGRISDVVKRARSLVESAVGLLDNAADLCEGTVWEDEPLEIKDGLEELDRKIDGLIEKVRRW